MASYTYTTLDDAKTAYTASLCYDLDNDTAQCAQHIAACRALLLLLPQTAAHGEASATFSPAVIEKRLNAAILWYNANSTLSAVHVAPYLGDNFR